MARRNDAPWRAACLEAWGHSCVACGAAPVQMDHIMPRSQGGPSVVENGLPLCPTCHWKKTAGTMVIEYHWLARQQVDWLAEAGWVEWDKDGLPKGRGFRRFGKKARDA